MIGFSMKTILAFNTFEHAASLSVYCLCWYSGTVSSQWKQKLLCSLCEVTSLILKSMSMIKDTYRILFTAEETIPCKLEAICIHSLGRQMKTPHQILKAPPGIASWVRSSCTGLGQRHPNNPKWNTVIHFAGQGNKNIEALKNHDLLLKAWPLSQGNREHIFFSNREMAESSRSSGLHWRLSSKEPTCNAGDAEDTGSIPGSGRPPGGGNGNPLQFFPGESHGQRSLGGSTVHKESDMTEPPGASTVTV